MSPNNLFINYSLYFCRKIFLEAYKRGIYIPKLPMRIYIAFNIRDRLGVGNLKINNKYIRYFVNRKFAVDAVCMAIFWVIVYIPVYLYTSKSFESAVVGLGSSAVLEILFGGVYGKFNDYVRKKAGVKGEE